MCKVKSGLKPSIRRHKMNDLPERRYSNISDVSLNRDDLSLQSRNFEYGLLRKCFSCSQLYVIDANLHKVKTNSVNRWSSSDDIKSKITARLLLKMIDSNAQQKCNFKLVFKNAVSVIPEISKSFKNVDSESNPSMNSIESIDRSNYYYESNNNDSSVNEDLLSANYSNRSTSVCDGSSPTDVSPSDYYSHENADEDHWEYASNNINLCDNNDMNSAQNNSLNISKCSCSSDAFTLAEELTDYDKNNHQKIRSYRSNSSDSAIILPFNDCDFEANILSLDSGSQTNTSNNTKMDFRGKATSYQNFWSRSLKSTSGSCPSLETPSVIISDHSDLKSCEDNSNVLALAIENLLNSHPSSPSMLRRDSITSIGSSTSSLSSLGEEDFIFENTLNINSCKSQLEYGEASSDDLSSDWDSDDNPALDKPKSKNFNLKTLSSLSVSPLLMEILLSAVETQLSSTPSAWRKVRSLVTSPFIQTYKKQKYPWVQLAGHQGNFISGQIQGTILKKLSGNEENCFKLIMSDIIRPLVPEYKKTLKINNENYLELQDLLANFKDPSIMDIKMGVRTYLEEELTKARKNPKLRKDMYEKMIAIDPLEPTEDENRMKAVTKPRYMIWRETISSTASLGFRIEGIKQSNGKTIKDFKRTKTEDHVKTAFEHFITNHSHCISLYLNKLKIINETLKLSQFFKNHELIGSSLLFVHDNKKADIWLIDFAKTHPLPNGVKISHIKEWQVGNHEDGYLIGLESLIRIFSDIKQM